MCVCSHLKSCIPNHATFPRVLLKPIDGIITIAETLQERFHEYLNECGYKYHDDRTLEDVLEEICEDATVDYDKATIDFQSLTQKIEPQENIGDSVEYTNNGAEDQERSFNRTVEYSVGSESCKTTVHGWSTSGEVHASFKGVGAKAATTHTTSTSKMHKQAEGTKTTHTFNESIYVPSESKVRVTVKKKVKVTNCKVYGLSVTFQRKKAKFNCIIQSGQKRKNRKEEFKIKNIFSDNVDVKSSTVTVRMGGNYIWFEPSVYIDKHTSDI